MSSDSTPPMSDMPDLTDASASAYPVYPLVYPPVYPPVYLPVATAGDAPYPSPYPSPYPYPAPGYYPWMFAPPAPRLGTWALVSMICGAVSLAGFQTIPAVLAVIFGFIGLNEIKKAPPGQVEGRGLAIAGVIMGFVSVGIGLAILLLYVLYIVVLLSAFQTIPG